MVEVVVDGAKGRIVDAIVGAPYAETPARGCLYRSFTGEVVLPFEGERRIAVSFARAARTLAAPVG